MKKNYQIPKCKKCCNYSKKYNTCVYFDKRTCPTPYTIEIADLKNKHKNASIDYIKNICKNYEFASGVDHDIGVRRTPREEIERSNERWFRSGWYYGQS